MNTPMYSRVGSFGPTTDFAPSRMTLTSSPSYLKRLSQPSILDISPFLKPSSTFDHAPSSKRARLSGPEGCKVVDTHHQSEDLDKSWPFQSQSELDFKIADDLQMDFDQDQGPLDFAKDWIFGNAIDQAALDSLELGLTSPIPFGLPSDSKAFPHDLNTPSLLGISFYHGNSTSGQRNIDQRERFSAFDVAPVDGLSEPTSFWVDPALPPSSSVQEWERGMKTWSQGRGEGAAVTPDSSRFGFHAALPFSSGVGAVVGGGDGGGGSKKRDGDDMETIYQIDGDEDTDVTHESEPATISTSELITSVSFEVTELPPKPYMKLVSPGKRKDLQFRLGYDETAVRMLREAQMVAMVQLAIHHPITPSTFPLSDLLLPLLDTNNPNFKARTNLYYNLLGRSPPSPSNSPSELDGAEPTLATPNHDEEEDPRALDLNWYKKEWFALGYTEEALTLFGRVE